MMEIRPNDGLVKLFVYPDAYHVFDAPGPGRRYFGHWLEYNAAAAEQATEAVKRFLVERTANAPVCVVHTAGRPHASTRAETIRDAARRPAPVTSRGEHRILSRNPG